MTVTTALAIDDPLSYACTEIRFSSIFALLMFIVTEEPTVPKTPNNVYPSSDTSTFVDIYVVADPYTVKFSDFNNPIKLLFTDFTKAKIQICK